MTYHQCRQSYRRWYAKSDYFLSDRIGLIWSSVDDCLISSKCHHASWSWHNMLTIYWLFVTKIYKTWSWSCLVQALWNGGLYQIVHGALIELSCNRKLEWWRYASRAMGNTSQNLTWDQEKGRARPLITLLDSRQHQKPVWNHFAWHMAVSSIKCLVHDSIKLVIFVYNCNGL